MSEVYRTHVQATLNRILERLGISMDELTGSFIAESPPFLSDVERAKTIVELDTLLQHGGGPQGLIEPLLRALKTAA